jgi:hypothetical protein
LCDQQVLGSRHAQAAELGDGHGLVDHRAMVVDHRAMEGVVLALERVRHGAKGWTLSAWMSTFRRLDVHVQAPGCPRSGAWMSTFRRLDVHV